MEILKGKAIEQEELKQDKINHYVLETLDYSKKEMKRKYKDIIVNIFTIIIIGIVGFLFFINIHYIQYLSYSYTYNFNDSTIIRMKQDMESIKQYRKNKRQSKYF